MAPKLTIKAKAKLTEPLLKSLAPADTRKFQKAYGSVIAIGPMGGKIIGYANGKPVYLGSAQAAKLAAHQMSAEMDGASSKPKKSVAEHVQNWLETLGLKSKSQGAAVHVDAETGAAISNSFGVAGWSPPNSTTKVFSANLLKPFVGQALKPTPGSHEDMSFKAKASAGEFESDPFPAINTLQATEAGKFAGSHGNKLFTAPDGSKFIFKTGNPAIARAEEAASRIGRLILGDDKVPGVKHVQLNGQDGVLMQVIPGKQLDSESGKYHQATMTYLHDHADQVAQHAVLDWIISNHDSHAGNFLLQDGGNIAAIDKGQAWKFLGKDKLDASYKPNASPTIYNTFWNQTDLDKAKVLDGVKQAFAAADKITPEQYTSIVMPYAATIATKQGSSATAIADKMTARFLSAKEDFTNFLAKKFGMTKEAVAGAISKTPLVEATTPAASEAKSAPVVASNLPVGQSKTVKKKNLGDVTLTAKPDGYHVAFTFKGQKVEQTFATVSAAAKFAFIHQEGHTDAAAYKAATGKAVPGVSWAHFGLGKPAAAVKDATPPVPAVETAPEKVVAASPSTPQNPQPPPSPAKSVPKDSGWEEWKKNHPQSFEMTDDNALIDGISMDSAGSKYVFPNEGGIWSIEKNTDAPDSSYTLTTHENVKIPLSGSAVTDMLNHQVKNGVPTYMVDPPPKAASSTPTPAPTDSPLGKKHPLLGMNSSETVANLKDIAPGTTIEFYNSKGDPVAYTKKPGMPVWASKSGQSVHTNTIAQEMVASGKPDDSYADFPMLVTPPENAASKEAQATNDAIWKQWKASDAHAAAQPVEASTLSADDPVGTKYAYQSMISGNVMQYTKVGPDNYALQNLNQASPFPGANSFEDLQNDLGDEFKVFNHVLKVVPGATPPVPVPDNKPNTTQLQNAKAGTQVTTVNKWGQKLTLTKLGDTPSAKWTDGSYSKWTAQKVAQHIKHVADFKGAIGGNIHTSFDTLPGPVKLKTVHMTDALDQMLAAKTPGGASLADKPTNWPSWVPPVGVVYESTNTEGPKYYIVQNKAGYGVEGPGTQVSFYVFNENGQGFAGKSVNAKSASNSVADAAKKAGIPGDFKTIQKLFGLTQPVAAGSNYKTMAESHMPAVPAGSSPDQPAWSMTPKVKASKVTTTVKLQALLDKSGLDTKTTGDVTFIAWNGKLDDLEAKAKTLGFDDIATGGKQYNDHSIIEIPTWALNTDMAQTMTAFEAASLPKVPPAESYAGLPTEVKPYLAPGDAGVISDAIGAMPSGGVFKLATSNVFLQHKDGKWTSFTEGGNAVPITSAIAKQRINASGAYSIPPSEATDLNQWVEPVYTAKVDWKKTKEQKLKQAAQAALRSWLKPYKPITSEMSQALGHLQSAIGGDKFWAKSTPDGHVLVGSTDPGTIAKIKGLVKGAEDETSPGNLSHAVVSLQAIKDAIPSAKTMVGPDGNTYPLGTLFTEKVDQTLVKDALSVEQGFGKFMPDATGDANKIVAKFPSIGQDLVPHVEALVSKYGLKNAVIKKGGSNTLVIFDKDGLDSVFSSKTTIIPQLPAPPPSFQSQGIPGLAANNQVGQIAEVNRFDLGSLPDVTCGRTGHAVRLGATGVFRDNQVYVRKVQESDGTLYYEVLGRTAAKPGEAKGLVQNDSFRYRKTTGATVEGYAHPLQSYDASTDAQVEVASGTLGGTKYRTLHGQTDAVHSIDWHNDKDKPSLEGRFAIRIRADKDVEHALGEAFDAMGLDVGKALAEPTEDDTRLLKKEQILRASMGPVGVNDWSLGTLTEDQLDAKLKARGITNQQVEQAQLKTAMGGRIVTHVDQSAITQSRKLFPFINVSSPASAFARVHEGAFLSTQTKYENGALSGNGASAGSDENTGGAIGTFAYQGGGGKTGWSGINFSGPKVIFHPRVYDRTDWHAHDGDRFGTTQDGTDSHETVLKTFDASHAETIFHGGLDMRDAAGIACPNSSQRDELIQKLKDSGRTEVNGIPLDKFVISLDGKNSHKYVWDTLEGLKPGVLP